MDPALLANLHGASWQRLLQLSRKSSLQPDEAEEFFELYRSASRDLSAITTVAPDSQVAVKLSVIVHRARAVLSGTPRTPMSSLQRFFLRSLPAALYRVRWMFVGVTVFFVGIAVLSGVWLYQTPGLLDFFMPPEAQRALAQREFVRYYFENPNSIFAVGVWVNNAWIALQWVALGVTGIYVIVGLVLNAFNLGVSGAVMHTQDEAGAFYSYLLPHGIPEITCILIAAAAGLHMFIAWIIPGVRTRMEALAKEARSLITVGIGLIFMLLLSGLVEGFVTPSALPTWLRITIGVALTLGYFAYAYFLGRPVILAGGDGDLEEDRAGSEQLAAY